MRYLVENIQEKMYMLESNMKNNLIFYGISQEEGETAERLVGKVREVISRQLKMSREVVMTNVTRLYTGPEVQGCRPVLGNSQLATSQLSLYFSQSPSRTSKTRRTCCRLRNVSGRALYP